LFRRKGRGSTKLNSIFLVKTPPSRLELPPILFPQDLPNHLSTPEKQMEGSQPYSVSIAREMVIPLKDVIGFMVFLVNSKPEEGVDSINHPTEGLTTHGQNLHHQKGRPIHLSHNLQCYQG